MSNTPDTWPPPPSNRSTPDSPELRQRQNEIMLSYRTKRSYLIILGIASLIAMFSFLRMSQYLGYMGSGVIGVYAVMRWPRLQYEEQVELYRLQEEYEAAGNHL